MSVPFDTPRPDQLAQIEQLLNHFEQLETQLQEVRQGLAHSHRLATLGTIASIIAHEYNNILTPMISYAQMSLAKPDDLPLMRKAVERSLSSAERAANISSSLLGFAREADHEHAAPLQSTVKESIVCLAREPKKDGIELTVDLPDVQVAMSPLNLQQVFVNLLLNAVRVMRYKGGGHIQITGQVQGKQVHIDVADTGPGIPADLMDKLFQPFVTHRAELSSESEPTEPKGTGLGLCICQDLIRSASGDISVKSTVGHGATFHLMIPLADDIFDPPLK